jgi:hypothetical protein
MNYEIISHISYNMMYHEKREEIMKIIYETISREINGEKNMEEIWNSYFEVNLMKYLQNWNHMYFYGPTKVLPLNLPPRDASTRYPGPMEGPNI